MTHERATLTRLTVDLQQEEDCINYMAFGAAYSLSVGITAVERRSVTLTSAKTIKERSVEHSDDKNEMK